MEATKQSASPVFAQPDEKITRPEIAPINRLPADIFRIIFSYWSWDPRQLDIGREVCRRWRQILNDPRTLQILTPTVGCAAYGIRFSCKQLVKVANLYTAGLPKLDLALVSLNDTDLARLHPGIQNLKVRNCKINTNQLITLISKLTKKEVSFKIVHEETVDITAIFDAFRTHHVQLKKLKFVNHSPVEELINIKNAFIQFVNEGGLCQQACQLIISNNWFNYEVLGYLNKRGIQFSKLIINIQTVNDSREDEAIENIIKNGLLTQVCDFREISTSLKVTDALLEKRIQIKHFGSLFYHQALGLDEESDRRKTLFTTVARPNSSLVCQGIASPCTLSIEAPDLIEVSPHILTSSTFIKKMSVSDHQLPYDRSKLSQVLCAIIGSAKFVEGYGLGLGENIYDDSIFEALANSSIRMGQFILYMDSISRPHNPRLKITRDAFQRFLFALSQRQSSIETFELRPLHDQDVLLDQEVINTLAEMGRLGFRFRHFDLQLYQKINDPLNLLPLVKSKALSNCENVILKLVTENWPEILQELLDSNIRYLHILVKPEQFEEIKIFFKTHRFKCVINWHISMTSYGDRYEADVKDLRKQYFGEI